MLRSLATKILQKWSDDPGPRFAAALAFYTALTIVPLGRAHHHGVRDHDG